MKALPFLQKAAALLCLSLFVNEDNLAGENGHGRPMPDHRVDALESLPSSLFQTLYHWSQGQHPPPLQCSPYLS